jgi:hypothetical protein
MPTRKLFGVRRQSEAATALWLKTLTGVFDNPKRCRATLATALQKKGPTARALGTGINIATDFLL